MRGFLFLIIILYLHFILSRYPMKLFYQALLLLFTHVIAYSQTAPNIKFGSVSQQELDMKFEPSDSTAEAVLLYEKQHVSFAKYYASEVVVEYHGRIKILKASGLDQGNISLPYSKHSGDNEKITDIEGYTYNYENGKLITTPLEASSVFEEKISDNRFKKKIILSNVKVGSVIEYRYKRRTPFAINNTPHTWYFQGNIPFKWSEISVTIPATLYYRIIFGGYLPLYIKTSAKEKTDYDGFDGTTYRLVIKDAPAFKDEPFITSRKDYISKVEFEWLGYYSTYSLNTTNFANTWGNVATYLNKHEKFGERIDRGNYLNKVVSSFASITDSTERLNAAFNYIAGNFTWDGNYRILAAENLKTVFENRKGSSAEINLLLLVLLREMGFKPRPVLLISRGEGVIREEYPTLDGFNYVIVSVRINGKDVLMDATDPYTVPGFLPERCLNQKACVLLKDTVNIILVTALKSAELITINAEMDSLAKEIKGNYSAMNSNYKAHMYRQFIKYSNEGEKVLQDFYKKKNPDWDLSSIKIENAEKPSEPFKVNFDFKEEMATASADKVYLTPLFSEGVKENPFKAKDRYYPLDLFYPEETIVIVSLKIPANYRVEELPQKMAISIPDKGGKFTYSVEVEGDVIKIRSQLLLSKALYNQNEYHVLKTFYTTLVQKQAEHIVLKKIIN